MKTNVKQLAGLGLLTAVVVVLQVLAVVIRPSGIFDISLVLMPIVVGAALYGKRAGAWLGFVFGVVVIITDAAAFMVINAPAAIAVCLLKGTLAGLAAGAAFKLLEKKNLFGAVIAAAIVSPIVNTGVFLLGCIIFFMPAIEQWASAFGYADAASYLIFGMAGMHFIIEMIINIVLSSAVVAVIRIARKKGQ